MRSEPNTQIPTKAPTYMDSRTLTALYAKKNEVHKQLQRFADLPVNLKPSDEGYFLIIFVAGVDPYITDVVGKTEKDYLFWSREHNEWMSVEIWNGLALWLGPIEAKDLKTVSYLVEVPYEEH